MSKNPLLEEGMANCAWDAYEIASKNARINIAARADRRVVQAIGNAVASAGYHAADGTLDGHKYTAAGDFSVRELSRTQIATWVQELCEAGFVAFYRNWPGNLHIHANYSGLPQKRQLDGQNEDFFNGKDGLVSHSRINDEWWYPTQPARKVCESMFRLSNPAGRAGVVVASPLTTALKDAAPEYLTNALYLGDATKPVFWMPVIAGTSYAPVRAFGTALGLDTEYDPATNSIKYDGDDKPISLKIVGGVGHAPIRLLAAEVGLKLDTSKLAERKIIVRR